MEKREEEGQALLINGEDMLARCGDGQARQLKNNLDKLKERMDDTREKAERKRSGQLAWTKILIHWEYQHNTGLNCLCVIRHIAERNWKSTCPT